MLHAAEHREEIDVERAHEALVGRLVGRRGAERRADVVEREVQPPEASRDLVELHGERLGVADVDPQRDRAAALGADLVDRRDAGVGAASRDDDGGACGGERLRAHQADALRASLHERDLVLEHSIHDWALPGPHAGAQTGTLAGSYAK